MNSASDMHLTPKCAQMFGILTAFGFINSVVTTVRFSTARGRSQKGRPPPPRKNFLLDVLLEVRNGIDCATKAPSSAVGVANSARLFFGPSSRLSLGPSSISRNTSRVDTRRPSSTSSSNRSQREERFCGNNCGTVPKGRVVEDVAHCTPRTKYSSSVPTFFGFISRYSPSCVSSMRF